MAIRILQNVQAVDVAAVEQMFRDQGATSVNASPEGDGEFTVIAIFPDVERHADLAARLDGTAPGQGIA
jgi:hypothetical protein